MRIVVNKEAFSMHMLIRESLILGAMYQKKMMMLCQIEFDKFLHTEYISDQRDILKDKI